MRSQSTLEQIVTINTGPLSSLASFLLHASRPLHELSALHQSGYTPKLQWDLRNLQPGRINMACLTFFLATAYRVRQVIGETQLGLIDWNPAVLGFLDDIGFLALVKKYELFKWPDNLIGGYESGRTNPNTVLLDLSSPQDASLKAQPDWMYANRELVKEDLLLKCGRLFTSSKRWNAIPKPLEAQIARCCAELALNSVYWGDSPAFVGLQRSGKGITIAVSDCGAGFYRTLAAKDNKDYSADMKPRSHIEALALGSVYNRNEFGLYRVISGAMQRDGWVVLSSYSAELHWSPSLWSRMTAYLKDSQRGATSLSAMLKIIGPPLYDHATDKHRERGFFRLWHSALRGSSISIELPMNNPTSRDSISKYY